MYTYGVFNASTKCTLRTKCANRDESYCTKYFNHSPLYDCSNDRLYTKFIFNKKNVIPRRYIECCRWHQYSCFYLHRWPSNVLKHHALAHIPRCLCGSWLIKRKVKYNHNNISSWIVTNRLSKPNSFNYL